MRGTLLLFALAFPGSTLFAQNVYTIKADSVKITNCDSAELIIENHTQNVSGFLFNTGNGRTVFKKGLSRINDSLYLIGPDTLKVLTADKTWLVNGNAGTVDGTNFIGTTDNVPLNFRVNNITAGKINSSHITVLGYQAGQANTAGGLTAFGYNALKANTTGIANTAFGDLALSANTIGQENTAFGSGALESNTGGSNTAVGANALADNTTGGGNVAVGDGGLSFNINGNYNVAMGVDALQFNNSGGFNTAIGLFSMQTNTSGSLNTSIGSNSLQTNTVGSYNTAIGVSSLGYSTGNYNTAIGTIAGDSNTTGSGNTYIGFNTGLGIKTGSNNTVIGANVSGLPPTLSNNIILADGSGNIRVEAFNTGNVAIGSTSDNGNKLQVNGSAFFSDSVILNKVANGDSTDSVLVWNAVTHAIHKVAQSSVGGSAFSGMLNSSLAVNGTISARRLQLSQTGWPDYVFDSSYRLLPMAQLERYIKENNHLPGIPSAAEVERKGVDVGDNQAALLKKIEELTLYTIDQNKAIDSLKQEVDELKKMIQKRAN